MAVRLYAVESALYRTAGLIDRHMDGAHSGAAALAALEEFALEASLLKVSGSEMADFIVDENVQIHGGNGFVSDYPAERRYRDARPNRIFEGTNEINRLLAPGILMKRGLKGGLPLATAVKAVRDELMLAGSLKTAGADDALGTARRTAAALRKTVLAAVGLAMETYGKSLQHEQETLMSLSDLLIEAFGTESATLRATRAAAGGHPLAAIHADAATVIAHDAGLRVDVTVRTLLESMLTGEALSASLAGLRLEVPPANTMAARRRIADAVLSKRAYPFGE
jgi:hypothetical protein